MKGIVFSTADIQSRHRSFPKQEPTSLFITPKDEVIPYYTSDFLEKAIEQGYQVYVVSSRSILGPHDEWWIRLVGLQNIFLTPPPLAPPDPPDVKRWSEWEEYEKVLDHWKTERADSHRELKRYLKPWRRLFDRLGFKFPKDITLPSQMKEAGFLNKYGLWNYLRFRKSQET